MKILYFPIKYYPDFPIEKLVNANFIAQVHLYKGGNHGTTEPRKVDVARNKNYWRKEIAMYNVYYDFFF